MKLAILQHPGHNRVYYNAAAKLALAELKIAVHRFSVNCNEISIKEIEGVRYFYLETDNRISPSDLHIVSRLSFVFAIYELIDHVEKPCLMPIKREASVSIDEKISSLLKYQGKTNELFTRMMINVGLLSSDFSYADNIRMLDPVAGKGTTLFEGAIYGCDVDGIEIDAAAVHQGTLFFKKYLEEERMKHSYAKRQISGKGRGDVVAIQEFSYSKSKEEFKSEAGRKHLGMISGNSQDADKYFKHNTFHLIVGDLPYGIQHGSTAQKKTGSVSRDPSVLLRLCLPAWRKVLKPGGSIVMAWNSFLVSREQLSELFEKEGFEYLSDEPYCEFEHRVDQAIRRDIIVVKKK